MFLVEDDAVDTPAEELLYQCMQQG